MQQMHSSPAPRVALRATHDLGIAPDKSNKPNSRASLLSRIRLAGRLGRTILASEDFVDHCGDDGLQSIGRFAVAGFAAEQMVYGLADEGKDAP